MVRNEKARLEFDGGSEMFEFVGAGATAYVYRIAGDLTQVYVFIPDIKFKDGTSMEDTTKDTLAKAKIANPLNPYLPSIQYLRREFVAGPELNCMCKIYIMPFYRNIKKSEKKQWLEVKKLQKIRDDGMKEVFEVLKKRYKTKPSMTFVGTQAALRSCTLAKEKVNVLLYAALKTLYQYIDKSKPGITFEFNKNNVGIDPATGHLVLRDPLYDSRITAAVHKERRENQK
jgi:hypothetical protein